MNPAYPLTALILATASLLSPAAEPKPNILFIVGDDMGCADV